jgi:hypothetical protein
MLQQSSAYINPELGEGAVWASQQWVRLLRDWYAPNPMFLSGTASIAYLAPGVRIGERLRVAMRDASVEEFYVEGVAHSLAVVNGVAQHRTTLTVTRGHQNPVAAVAAYAERFRKQGRSALAQDLGVDAEPVLDDAVRDAIRNVLAQPLANEPTPLTGGPQGVTGTAPDGSTFAVPSATE